jgi:hypothetical protein
MSAISESIANSGEKLAGAIRQLLDHGYPDVDSPQPPGPWDPVIRGALLRTSRLLGSPLNRGAMPYRVWSDAPAAWPHGPGPQPWGYGPRPDPWHSPFDLASDFWRIAVERHPALWDLFGGNPTSLVALNPQPMPPGMLFAAALADEVVARAALLQEADAVLSRDGQTSDAGDYVNQFVRAYCGSEVRVRFPFPFPPPPWFKQVLDGADFVMMSAQFRHAARHVDHSELQRALEDAAAGALDAALSMN